MRTSSYGDSVTAGQAFDLSLGLYATDGNENLDDVIVSLTLPENILLNSGSLSNYVGTIAASTTADITPASSMPMPEKLPIDQLCRFTMLESSAKVTTNSVTAEQM